MKRIFQIVILSCILIAPVLLQAQQEILGVWNGYAELNGMKLRVIFGVEEKDGVLTGYMESPDQGGGQMPATAVKYEKPQLEIEVGSIGLLLKVSLQTEENTLVGSMIQSGVEFPVELGRESLESAVRRPQEPVPPYPYYTRDIRFYNEEAGIWLSGTLSLPEENAACPVAVMISGSGPQDRNEELLNHKPFLVIADHLARNGIGTLRFDDRGVAESEGNFAIATSRDFAGDVKAAVKYLEKESKATHIGLIGHSEGGMICAMVAANNPDIDFAISLAGTAVQGLTILYTQNIDLMVAEGLPQAEAERQADMIKSMCETVLAESDSTLAAQKLALQVDHLFTESEKALIGDLNQRFEQYNSTFNTNWMRFFLEHDPGKDWEMVKCPVLALNGTKDLQVAMKPNFDAMQAALIRAGNEDFTLTPMKDQNHLFQHSTTGSYSEYGKLEETFSPQALDLMTRWIHKRFK